jgi:hypothetical protein
MLQIRRERGQKTGENTANRPYSQRNFTPSLRTGNGYNSLRPDYRSYRDAGETLRGA